MGRTYTNTLGLSEAFLQSARGDYEKGNYSKLGKRSPTELIGPVRERMLTKRHENEITEDVSDKIWAILGSACHYILEQGKEEGSLVEYGFAIDVLGIKVRMKPDLVTPLGFDDEYRVVDIKTTSVFSVKDMKPKDEWIKQVNLYAYGLRIQGFNVTDARIEAILRDWSRSSMIQNRVKENYPLGFSKGQYPEHNVVILDIPLWTNDECREYLEERVRLFESCEHLPDDKLPFCTQKERWINNSEFKVVTKDSGSTVRGGKSFKTRVEAEEFLRERNKKKGVKPARVHHEMGRPKRCMYYCSARPFCNQYNDTGNSPF